MSTMALKVAVVALASLLMAMPLSGGASRRDDDLHSLSTLMVFGRAGPVVEEASRATPTSPPPATPAPTPKPEAPDVGDVVEATADIIATDGTKLVERGTAGTVLPPYETTRTGQIQVKWEGNKVPTNTWLAQVKKAEAYEWTAKGVQMMQGNDQDVLVALGYPQAGKRVSAEAIRWFLNGGSWSEGLEHGAFQRIQAWKVGDYAKKGDRVGKVVYTWYNGDVRLKWANGSIEMINKSSLSSLVNPLESEKKHYDDEEASKASTFPVGSQVVAVNDLVIGNVTAVTEGSIGYVVAPSDESKKRGRTDVRWTARADGKTNPTGVDAHHITQGVHCSEHPGKYYWEDVCQPEVEGCNSRKKCQACSDHKSEESCQTMLQGCYWDRRSQKCEWVN